jgi:hypothetical protein
MNKFVLTLIFLTLVLIPVSAEPEETAAVKEEIVPVSPAIDAHATEALINKDGLEYFPEDLVLDVDEDDLDDPDEIEKEFEDEFDEEDDEFDEDEDFEDDEFDDDEFDDEDELDDDEDSDI